MGINKTILDSTRNTSNKFDLQMKQEQDNWREYSEFLASVGYFGGCRSPLCMPVSSDLNDLFAIYSNPIKFFGNMEFVVETVDGYRLYFDNSWDEWFRSPLFVWFDSRDVLCAVDNYDSMECVEVPNCALSAEKRSAIYRYVEEGGGDPSVERMILRDRNDNLDFDYKDDSFSMSPAYKYVRFSENQPAVKGFRQYEDVFGCRYDIMRGSGIGSLGEIASLFCDEYESLQDRFCIYPRPYTLFFFSISKSLSAKVILVLQNDILSEASVEVTEDDSNFYVAAETRCSVDQSFAATAVFRLAHVSDDMIDFLCERAGFSEYRKSIEDARHTLKQNRIWVDSHTMHEFVLDILDKWPE